MSGTLLLPAVASGMPQINTVYCCEFFDLLRAIPDHSVDMILDDLPYGTTVCAWDEIIPLEPMWHEFKRIIKPKGAIVLTASQPFTSRLVMSNPEMFRYEWVWFKEQGKQPQLANLRPQKAHESVLVFSEPTTVYYPQFWKDVPYNKKAATKLQSLTHAPGFFGAEKRNQSERYPISYLYFETETGKHPTQKPVPLFEYLIRTYTQPDELVLDATCGSGTTAVAARNTGRRFICGDRSPEYVAIAKDRLRMPFEAKQVQRDTKVDDLPLFAVNS